MRQPQSFPSCGRQRCGLLGQLVFQWRQQQGQRGAEFVTDIAEKNGLGAVDLGERLGALALRLVGDSVDDHSRHRCGEQLEKCAIRLIQWQARAGTHHQHAGWVLVARKRDGPNECGADRFRIGAADQSWKAVTHVFHQYGMALGGNLGQRPSAVSGQIHRRRACGATGRQPCPSDEPGNAVRRIKFIKQRER